MPVVQLQLKLKDLYKKDVPYWGQRNVKNVENALNACNKAQLAYLFREVIPVFSANLKRGNVK